MRFIPAHAGNGPAERSSPWVNTTFSMSAIRSSPRMRRTAGGGGGGLGSMRFIPAHAGNGHRMGRCGTNDPVHPRACGERDPTLPRSSPIIGSSPRMRGTGAAARRRPRECRFIPAHAGNGSSAPAAGHSRPVHPRACGERSIRRAATFPDSGSSPRMRGTGHRQRRPCQS
jgi:hypothetical protein